MNSRILVYYIYYNLSLTLEIVEFSFGPSGNLNVHVFPHYLSYYKPIDSWAADDVSFNGSSVGINTFAYLRRVPVKPCRAMINTLRDQRPVFARICTDTSLPSWKVAKMRKERGMCPSETRKAIRIRIPEVWGMAHNGMVPIHCQGNLLIWQ